LGTWGWPRDGTTPFAGCRNHPFLAADGDDPGAIGLELADSAARGPRSHDRQDRGVVLGLAGDERVKGGFDGGHRGARIGRAGNAST
jgi:hypothetical protein